MKHINNPRVGAKYENRIQKLFFYKETFTKERIKKESLTKETSLFFLLAQTFSFKL